MFRPFRLRAVTLLPSIVGALLATATWTNAQSSTSLFHGLKHTAIGGASLQLDSARDALEVHPHDPVGGDGVAVHVDEATGWVARLRVTGPPASPLKVAWHAIADGRTISTATLQRDGNRFVLRAAFTGATKPTYSASVYNDGRLVASLGGLTPTANIVVPEGFCDTFGSVGFIACDLVSEFYNDIIGRCAWGHTLPTPGTIGLPNGAQVTGNELRLVEEVRPGGHYPYLSFDAIMVLTNASPLTLFAEHVR
jgi:hypothetical protein